MNYKEIKEIVDDFGNAKIDEISIEFPDGTKVSMKKNTAPVMPKESVQYIVPTPAEKTEVVGSKITNGRNILFKIFSKSKTICRSWKQSKKRRYSLHS